MLGVHVPLVNLTQKLVQGVLQDVVVLSKEKKQLDRGGGQVVSVLAFYSDNPSLNTDGYLNYL